jgi:hypothetical protein
MSPKTSLIDQWKRIYQPSAKEPALLEIPTANYLMIDGSGSPNSNPRYQAAIQTLYPLAYGLKFAVRKQKDIDYGVMPLEGLYWGTPKGQTHFTEADKELWSWTLMILQPQWVTQELYEAQFKEVKRKKSPLLIDEIRFESFTEGLVTTLLHIGPFDSEERNVLRMHQFAFDQGYELSGKHHEIYLNDFTKTAPERLKTVLRHPVTAVA